MFTGVTACRVGFLDGDSRTALDATPVDAARDLSEAKPGDAAIDLIENRDTGFGPDEGSDGHAVDSRVDSGANRPPTIVRVVFAADPFTDQTEVSAVTLDPEGAEVACRFVVNEPASGAVVEPLDFVSPCQVILHEDRLPRGALIEVSVTARDEQGATSVSAATVTVGNHRPVVVVEAAGEMFPGDEVVLRGQVEDPDQAGQPPDGVYGIEWRVVPPVPAGIVVRNPNGLEARLVVDRPTYDGGPGRREILIALAVMDDRGSEGTDQMTVVVLDERGPCVDNTSPFHGTGPTAYCGAQAHPCNTIADALVNVTAAIRDGAPWEPLVLVATTGQPYLLPETLLLHRTSMSCGYQQASYTREDGYERTPLRYASSTGIVLEGDVLLEGCDVRRDADVSGAPIQVGVHVRGAAHVSNCAIAVASRGEILPAYATDLLLEPRPSDRPLIEDCAIGPSRASVSSTALHVVTGVADLTGNRIEAGPAAASQGIVARFSWSEEPATVIDNRVVSGPGSSYSAGIVIESGNPIVHYNQVRANGAQDVIGVEIFAAALDVDMKTNTVFGNNEVEPATRSIGVRVEGSVELQENVIHGGFGLVATGLFLAGTASATTLGDDISGEGEGGAIMEGVGVAATSGATLLLEETRIRGNTEMGEMVLAVGLRTRHSARVTGNNSVIESGSASEKAIGFEHGSGFRAVVQGATVTAGHVPGGDSIGLSLDGAVLLSDTLVQAGEAEESSTGILLTAAAGGTEISNCTIQAAQGATSIGLRSAAITGLVVEQSRITGTRHSTDTSAASTGVKLEDTCVSCRFEGNYIVGAVGEVLGPSVGVSVWSPEPFAGPADERTCFVNNRIEAGGGLARYGILASGNPEEDMLFLHNLIVVGGPGPAIGVMMGTSRQTDHDRVGVFVGNILLADLGFNGGCALGRYAEPTRAANNCFGHHGGHLVVQVRGHDGLCDEFLVLDDIDMVNATAPYHGSGDNLSYSMDPHHSDLFHLPAGSPLADKAALTFTYWDEGTMGPLTDIDGQERPLPDDESADIGPDELPNPE